MRKARTIWHERPVLAPLVYGTSTFLAGSLAYATGYLLTDSIRNGMYAMLFVDTLLVLYLRECHKSARRRRT